MNSLFHSKLPESNSTGRARLFAGDLFLTAATGATRRLIDDITGLLQEHLQTKAVRTAHLEIDDATFFERMGRIRRSVYLDPHYHRAVRAIVEECGFDRDRIAFDPIRLRVVSPGGHLNPLAAPVYYPHRDTWYAHPQSLVVWWIPLHDVVEEETFVFYPEFFDQAVPNNSEIFDYADWIKDGPALKIGWQKRDSGVTGEYPRALEERRPEKGIGFACERAEQLIFAGSHYHQTLKHNRSEIRYSLDFRVVHLDDVEKGQGAPNADNRSRGSSVGDYVRAADLQVE